jgi:hypothetical protein
MTQPDRWVAISSISSLGLCRSTRRRTSGAHWPDFCSTPTGRTSNSSPASSSKHASTPPRLPSRALSGSDQVLYPLWRQPLSRPGPPSRPAP